MAAPVRDERFTRPMTKSTTDYRLSQLDQWQAGHPHIREGRGAFEKPVLILSGGQGLPS